MNVSAYKHNDGTKSVEIEFNQSEVGESVFANMLIDRFLEIPVLAFNGGGDPKDVADAMQTLFKVAGNNGKTR